MRFLEKKRNIFLWDKSRLFTILSLFGVSVFATLQSYHSPLNQIVSGGSDSAIFSYIGWRMRYGDVPYVTIWDNKGPLMYFLEFLGMLLSDRFGLFFIELIMIFVASLLVYQFLGIIVGKRTALFATIYVFFLLCSFLEGGNLSEEMALPFISAGFYCLITQISDWQTIKKLHLILAGSCCAACFLLRITLVIPILSFLLILLLDQLVRKGFSTAIRIFLWFALGFGIFCLPFAFYLLQKDAFSACLSAAYGMNFTPQKSDLITRLNKAFQPFFLSHGNFHLILAGLFCLCMPIYLLRGTNHKLKIIWIASSAALLGNILINVISGMSYRHYFIANIPLMVFPAAIVFEGLAGLLKTKIKNRYCINIILFAFLGMISIGSVMENIQLITIHRHETYSDLRGIISEIQANSRAEDPLVCFLHFDFCAQIYRNSYHPAAARFIYGLDEMPFSESLKTEARENIQNSIITKTPRVIVTHRDFLPLLIQNNPTFEQFLKQNYQPKKHIPTKEQIPSGVLMFIRSY